MVISQKSKQIKISNLSIGIIIIKSKEIRVAPPAGILVSI